ASNTVCDPAVGTSDPTGSIQVTVSNPAPVDGNYTFTWFKGAIGAGVARNNGDTPADGSVVVVATSGGGNVSTISGLVAGTYYVTIQDTNNPHNGCITSVQHTISNAFVPVTINLAADVVPAPVSDCDGTPSGEVLVNFVRLNGVQDNTDNYNITLQTAAGANVGTANINAGNVNFTDVPAGSYFLKAVRKTTGCASGLAQVTVGTDGYEPVFRTPI
ncbi:MAG: hypothetical protein RJP96_11565, partial [Algiphilus sp.]|uniref:hypothetical protein n=1 Tax=Algiphilus sp. TaxID=1872431 RepID=UPI0032EAE27C